MKSLIIGIFLDFDGSNMINMLRDGPLSSNSLLQHRIVWGY